MKARTDDESTVGSATLVRDAMPAEAADNDFNKGERSGDRRTI